MTDTASDLRPTATAGSEPVWPEESWVRFLARWRQRFGPAVVTCGELLFSPPRDVWEGKFLPTPEGHVWTEANLAAVLKRHAGHSYGHFTLHPNYSLTAEPDDKFFVSAQDNAPEPGCPHNWVDQKPEEGLALPIPICSYCHAVDWEILQASLQQLLQGLLQGALARAVPPHALMYGATDGSLLRVDLQPPTDPRERAILRALLGYADDLTDPPISLVSSPVVAAQARVGE